MAWFSSAMQKGSNKNAKTLAFDDCPDVFHSSNLTSAREKSRELVPSYWILILFGVYLLLAFFSHLIDDNLPTPILESEADFSQFSEEHAWRYLQDIVGTGPRVAGSIYHLNKTVELKALLDTIASSAVQTVRTDWQIADGDYWLAYRRPYVNAYENVTNIIALLEGESGVNADGTSNSSLLLNCHYDSVPTSPGASDNALFCAAMMEVLFVLSKRTEKLRYNIIFLFNGAEENPLQASHAFLQHRWSEGVTALVNLDSAGMNSKSNLFQVSDPRVLNAYTKSVKMPKAQSLGEFLFTTGIVPSDTDFRIFRDFGHIYGIDIAFSKFGHVYHTRYDCLELIKPGVLQHAGDMLNALSVEIATDDRFSNKINPSSYVYWDYIHVFMVAYSFEAATVIDSLIVILALASVGYYLFIVGLRWSMAKELLYSVLSRLVSLITGCAIVGLMTVLSVLTTVQLRYLSHWWIVVATIWTPFLIGSVWGSQVFDAWRTDKCGLNRVRRSAQAMAATRLIISILMIPLLFILSTSTFRYGLTVPLFIMSLCSIISITAIRFSLTAWKQLLLNYLLSVPSVLFFYSLAYRTISLMLPIMGRSLSATPDYVAAGLNLALVIITSIPVSGLELLFSRRNMWKVLSVPMLTSLVITFLPLNPYRNDPTSPALQRHFWFHSEIIDYNFAQEETKKRTGIWFGHIDVNTPNTLTEAFQNINLTLEPIHSCDDLLYCNLPMVTPRTVENAPRSLWLNLTGPSQSYPDCDLNLLNKTTVGTTVTLQFSATGPSHRSIIIKPRTGVDLSEWSLNTSIRESKTNAERPVYFIYYSKGTYSEEMRPYAFDLTFTISSDLNPQVVPIVEMSYNCHRTNNDEENTQEYTQIINSMPDWFNIATYLSTRKNFFF